MQPIAKAPVLTETVAKIAQRLDPEAWQAVAKLEDMGAATPPLGHRTGTVSASHQALQTWRQRKEASILSAKDIIGIMGTAPSNLLLILQNAGVTEEPRAVWQRIIRELRGD
ncbi:MAG: hypothetical protein KGL26_01060 [Pseudomonadota bacterium]|nr:hypothetical protein [Pseudomonadota bacterium]